MHVSPFFQVSVMPDSMLLKDFAIAFYPHVNKSVNKNQILIGI